MDSHTIWALKRNMRSELIAMARERLAASSANRGLPTDWVADVLDPDVVTFGFARRVPSYKRLTLMLRDPERLKALLTDPKRPIQIVIAGKSHPADEGGKALIQQMVQFADDPGVRERIVFLPDYDISMAKPLYPGCDVWMNNPLRPYEACGTSGMKAALNGAANLSIRDGWWDEWFDPAFGWEIPSAEGIDDPDRRDDLEAKALYDIIENEIVPRFYDPDRDGLPERWIQMIRETIAGLGPEGAGLADGPGLRDQPLRPGRGLGAPRWSRRRRGRGAGRLEAPDPDRLDRGGRGPRRVPGRRPGRGGRQDPRQPRWSGWAS